MLRECSRPIVAVIVCVALAAPIAACGEDDGAETGSRPKATDAGPADVTPLRRRVEEELRRLIEAGDAKVDTDCVIEELRSTLSNAVFEDATEAARRGEEIPREAVDAAYEAGQRCRNGR